MLLPPGDSPHPTTPRHPGLPAMMTVLRAAAWIQDRHAAFFKAYDLTAQQFNVLRILRGAGEEGLPCAEVSNRMLHRVPDITRLVDRLERQGLVSRQRSKDDRRVIRCLLTQQARELLTRLDEPFLQLQAEILDRLGAQDYEQLESLLERMMDIRRGA